MRAVAPKSDGTRTRACPGEVGTGSPTRTMRQTRQWSVFRFDRSGIARWWHVDVRPLAGRRIPFGLRAAAALADLHRRDAVRLRAGVALRPGPADARKRPDAHLGDHLRALSRRLAALPHADRHG